MTYFNLLTPLILFCCGIGFKCFSHRKINTYFGYASSYAKKSELVWHYAQQIAATYCLIGAIILVLLMMMLHLIAPLLMERFSNLIPLVYSLGLVALIELQLRKKFDEDGQEKP